MALGFTLDFAVNNLSWWTSKLLEIEHLLVDGSCSKKFVHLAREIKGLKRNGKSCRLRWVNYLRPDLKKGDITPQEESIIIELHAKFGNR
ncbi:hypothetical protein LguiB_013916 [Lonicera macranthoides]